jgi:hypothetical protein
MFCLYFRFWFQHRVRDSTGNIISREAGDSSLKSQIAYPKHRDSRFLYFLTILKALAAAAHKIYAL